MNPNIHQPIALVTGANRGIGRETAGELARRGFHVVVAARNVAAGQGVVAELQAAGGVASFLSLDVSDSTSIAAAREQFAAIADRLDVLVNNAGIYVDEGVNVLVVPRETMVRTFATNTFGPLEVVQAFLPYLRRSPAARVINISSGYGELSGLSADVPSYCLSKLLNGLTIMLAAALRGEGIAVNSMCPGWVRTDMGGPNATLSVDQGADTAVWLAAQVPHEWTGKFFRGRQEIAW